MSTTPAAKTTLIADPVRGGNRLPAITERQRENAAGAGDGGGGRDKPGVEMTYEEAVSLSRTPGHGRRRVLTDRGWVNIERPL